MSAITSPAARPIGPIHRVHGTELLVLLATGCLVTFYYLARADSVGVSSPARVWRSLTGTPLDASWHFVASAVLLGAIPVIGARLLTGLTLRQLGLGLGRWREGLRWLALGIPLAIVAGYIGAQSASMRAVYPLDPRVPADAASFVPYALTQFLYFAAWEVLFRGVLLFGLAARIGGGPANAVQTAVSVTAHFGRALNETTAALGAGFVFGWITLRTRSVWYLAVVHWVIGVSQDWFILIG